MKKSKLTTIILSTIVILGTIIPTAVSAKTTYNEISSMKDVSYQFNNDITKHEIGDIDTLVYVDDTGRVLSTGNIALLDDIHIDESKLDTLYYIKKDGGIATVYGVDGINYTNENGSKIGSGTGPGNKSSKVISSDSKSTTNNANKSTDSTKKTGWIKDGTDWTYVYSDGQRCNFSWLQQGDDWYYFDVFGHMVKDGRLKIGDKMYLLDSDGRLQENTDTKKTGWVKDGYIMERGDSCEDFRYVYSNGKNCVGWLQDGGYWYYFDKCGHMVKDNKRKIDGKIYSFDSKGHIEVNMSKRNLYTETTLNHTGPTDGSGLVRATTFYNIVSDANGVCTITNDYYDNVNIMLCHKEGHCTNDGSYHGILFDKNGDQVFGWFLEPVHVGSDVTTGGTKLADRWTYYDENGAQVTSASKVIDGKTYSFDSNGYLV